MIELQKKIKEYNQQKEQLIKDQSALNEKVLKLMKYSKSIKNN